MKEKISIDALYFGVVLFPQSWTNTDDRREPTEYNLFDFSRVKTSVARWVTMKPSERDEISNPLLFLFGDVWSRTEFEFMMCPWPFEKDEKISESGIKVDTYRMYVLPNAKLLLDMVNRVSKSSAQKYLTEARKAYRK